MSTDDVVERARACAERCEHDGRGCKCAAWCEAQCGCDDAEWASPHESARVIRELLAIVERLAEALRQLIPQPRCPHCGGTDECVYHCDFGDGDPEAYDHLMGMRLRYARAQQALSGTKAADEAPEQ